MNIYSDVEQSWVGMLDEIASAKSSILLEQYLISDMNEGQIGHSLAKVLIDKATEGIKIKILVDAVGSHEFILSKQWDELKKLGAELKIFGLIPRWRFKIQPPFLNRNHRKLLIIDERVVFVGGVVFTESVRGWDDFNLRLEDCADNFKKSFDLMWDHVRAKENHQIFSCGDFSIANIIPHRDIYYREILARIRKAKDRVWIISPYFSPDLRIRRSMYNAARRSVDVKLLLPEKTDNVLADMASRSFIGTLLRRRVKVFTGKGKINHAKIIIIDNWVSFGSLNFDRLSFFYNYELNVDSSKDEVVAKLIPDITKFFNTSVPLKKKIWEHPSLVEKIRRIFGFFIRPFA
jgi:cardiolipin synthase A/B